jgi:hypothetical protein
MKTHKDVRHITVQLSHENLKKLKILAIQNDQSMSEYTRELLEKVITVKRRKDVDEPILELVTAEL